MEKKFVNLKIAARILMQLYTAMYIYFRKKVSIVYIDFDRKSWELKLTASFRVSTHRNTILLFMSYPGLYLTGSQVV